MAIYALGARPNKPQSQILQAALGELDENGVPFEVIEVTTARREADSTSMHGCQDTFVSIEGGRVEITHREQGRVKWIKGKMGTRSVAYFANTEENLNFLASHFNDGSFIIKDSIVKAEVKSRYDKMVEKMTQEQKEKMAKQIEDSKKNPHGGTVVLPGRKTLKEVELEEERKILDQKRRELDKKENELKQKEEFIAQRASGDQGEVTVVHAREELQALDMPQIRKLARGYYKLKIENTDKKADIINMIIKPVSTEVKTETVTG